MILQGLEELDHQVLAQGYLNDEEVYCIDITAAVVVEGKSINLTHTQRHLQELVDQRMATWQHEIQVSTKQGIKLNREWARIGARTQTSKGGKTKGGNDGSNGMKGSNGMGAKGSNGMKGNNLSLIHISEPTRLD
eukprot:12932310-Prorocentrum_lima.AAC.1